MPGSPRYFSQYLLVLEKQIYRISGYHQFFFFLMIISNLKAFIWSLYIGRKRVQQCRFCLTMSLTFKSSSSFSSTPFPPYFLSFLLLLLQKLQPKSSSCYFGRFPVLPKGSRITSELQSYINLAIFNFLNSSTIYPLSSCPQLTIWPQPALSLAQRIS